MRGRKGDVELDKIYVAAACCSATDKNSVVWCDFVWYL